jgi:hypothetical protein
MQAMTLLMKTKIYISANNQDWGLCAHLFIDTDYVLRLRTYTSSLCQGSDTLPVSHRRILISRHGGRH